ncbi:unnamed protein product [Durusdinium trenchii]|uniref:Uncharacterized protein n=1 Tax=Durusdinium trenchii TaxID=1381693 RepID=A0ABP0LMV0_9DINO
MPLQAWQKPNYWVFTSFVDKTNPNKGAIVGAQLSYLESLGHLNMDPGHALHSPVQRGLSGHHQLQYSCSLKHMHECNEMMWALVSSGLRVCGGEALYRRTQLVVAYINT